MPACPEFGYGGIWSAAFYCNLKTRIRTSNEKHVSVSVYNRPWLEASSATLPEDPYILSGDAASTPQAEQGTYPLNDS